jgi:hypothetical protein
MKFRFPHRPWAVLAGLALCGGVTGLALAATGATASAESFNQLIPISSGMRIDVKGAVNYPGPNAPVIQWPATGGANQNWNVPGVGSSGLIQSEHSGLCLTTDGVPGDTLYQDTCTNGNPFDTWTIQDSPAGDAINGNQAVTILNQFTGLVVDVFGDSYNEGATMDAWYPNGQFNQIFWVY